MITISCKEIKLIQCFQRRRRRSCSSGSFLAGSSVVLSSVVSVVSSVVRLSGQPGIFQVSPERAAVVLPEATYPYSLQPEYTQIQIQNIEYTNTHVYKYKLPNTNTKSSIISVCVLFRRQLIRTLWRLCGTLRRRSNKLFAEIGCLSKQWRISIASRSAIAISFTLLVSESFGDSSKKKEPFFGRSLVRRIDREY